MGKHGKTPIGAADHLVKLVFNFTNGLRTTRRSLNVGLERQARFPGAAETLPVSEVRNENKLAYVFFFFSCRPRREVVLRLPGRVTATFPLSRLWSFTSLIQVQLKSSLSHQIISSRGANELIGADRNKSLTFLLSSVSLNI